MLAPLCMDEVSSRTVESATGRAQREIPARSQAELSAPIPRDLQQARLNLEKCRQQLNAGWRPLQGVGGGTILLAGADASASLGSSVKWENCASMR